MHCSHGELCDVVLQRICIDLEQHMGKGLGTAFMLRVTLDACLWCCWPAPLLLVMARAALACWRSSSFLLLCAWPWVWQYRTGHAKFSRLHFRLSSCTLCFQQLPLPRCGLRLTCPCSCSNQVIHFAFENCGAHKLQLGTMDYNARG